MSFDRGSGGVGGDGGGGQHAGAGAGVGAAAGAAEAMGVEEAAEVRVAKEIKLNMSVSEFPELAFLAQVILCFILFFSFFPRFFLRDSFVSFHASMIPVTSPPGVCVMMHNIYL